MIRISTDPLKWDNTRKRRTVSNETREFIPQISIELPATISERTISPTVLNCELPFVNCDISRMIAYHCSSGTLNAPYEFELLPYSFTPKYPWRGTIDCNSLTLYSEIMLSLNIENPLYTISKCYRENPMNKFRHKKIFASSGCLQYKTFISRVRDTDLTSLILGISLPCILATSTQRVQFLQQLNCTNIEVIHLYWLTLCLIILHRNKSIVIEELRKYSYLYSWNIVPTQLRIYSNKSGLDALEIAMFAFFCNETLESALEWAVKFQVKTETGVIGCLIGTFFGAL